jgi:hypothetical protein
MVAVLKAPAELTVTILEVIPPKLYTVAFATTTPINRAAMRVKTFFIMIIF